MTLVIKATIEKRKTNFDMIQTLTEILKDVRNKQLLTDFKENYNAWSRKFSEDWNSYETTKSNGFKALKPSEFIRTVMTAIFFFSILEYFNTTNVLFLALAFNTVGVFIALNVISVTIVSYFSAPWKSVKQVLEYFKTVKIMSTRFSRRLNIIKRTLFLNFNTPDLYLYNGYENEKRFWDVLFPTFFVFNIYGVLLAIIILTACHHADYDSFLLVESLTLYFLIIVALRNDLKIFTSCRNSNRIQKKMVIITEDFKTWLQNDCELKCILQGLNINNVKLSFFPSKNVMIFEEEAYLNFIIFLVMFENALHRYLNTNKASELFLYLLNGNCEKINKAVRKGLSISSRHNLNVSSDNYNDKENLLAHNQTVSDQIYDVSSEKKKNKSENKVGGTAVEDNSYIVNTSRIPKLLKEVKNDHADKSKDSPNNILLTENSSYKLLKGLKFDENLQIRQELSPKKLKKGIPDNSPTTSFENICETISSNSLEEDFHISRDRENAEGSRSDSTQGFNDIKTCGIDGCQNVSFAEANDLAENSCASSSNLVLKNESEMDCASESMSTGVISESGLGQCSMNDDEILKLPEMVFLDHAANGNALDTVPNSVLFESKSNELEFDSEKNSEGQHLLYNLQQNKEMADKDKTNFVNVKNKSHISNSVSISTDCGCNQNNYSPLTNESRVRVPEKLEHDDEKNDGSQHLLGNLQQNVEEVDEDETMDGNVSYNMQESEINNITNVESVCMHPKSDENHSSCKCYFISSNSLQEDFYIFRNRENAEASRSDSTRGFNDTKTCAIDGSQNASVAEANHLAENSCASSSNLVLKNESEMDCVSESMSTRIISENGLGQCNMNDDEILELPEMVFLDHAANGKALHTVPNSVLFESKSNELEFDSEKNSERRHLLHNLQQKKEMADKDENNFFNIKNKSDNSVSVSISTDCGCNQNNYSPLTNESRESAPEKLEHDDEKNGGSQHLLGNLQQNVEEFDEDETMDENLPYNMQEIEINNITNVERVGMHPKSNENHSSSKCNFMQNFIGQQNCELISVPTGRGDIKTDKNKITSPILAADIEGTNFTSGATNKNEYDNTHENNFISSLQTEKSEDIVTSLDDESRLSCGKSNENKYDSISDDSTCSEQTRNFNFSLNSDQKLNFSFNNQSSGSHMPFSNTNVPGQTPMLANTDVQSFDKQDTIERTEVSSVSKTGNVVNINQSAKPEANLNDDEKLKFDFQSSKNSTQSNSSNSGNSPLPRKTVKGKRRNKHLGNSTIVIQGNAGDLFNATQFKNDSNCQEFIPLNVSKALIAEKNPLRTNSVDSLSLPSDLNSGHSENQMPSDIPLNTSNNTSKQYLLQSPASLTNKSSSHSDYRDITANAFISGNGILVSPDASADLNASDFQTSDEFISTHPQSACVLNKCNADELFNIGEYESQALSTSRLSYLLQLHKTKDCTVKKASAEVQRKIVKARRKTKEYFSKISSVDISENEEMRGTDKSNVGQSAQIMDCNEHTLETYHATPPESSIEYLVHDTTSAESSIEYQSDEPFQNCAQESGNMPSGYQDHTNSVRRSSSFASSEEAPSGYPKFKDIDYHMIGSSEDENYYFHNSTTDTSCRSQGSSDIMLKRLQRLSEIDEDQSAVTVHADYDSGEDRTDSVCLDGKEQKGVREYKNSQTSTSNKVQSKETTDSISEGGESIDNKHECSSSYRRKQGYGTVWKSDMEMEDRHKFSKNSDSRQILNDSDGERTDSFFEERQDAKPLRYNLKYENLDLTVLDSSPCITIKLICEKEIDNPRLETNQLRLSRTPEHRLSSNYEVLLTPEESSVRSSSEVPYTEINKLNLTVTAGQEAVHETLNPIPQPVLNERNEPQENPQNKSETSKEFEDSGFKDDLNSIVNEEEKPGGHSTDENATDNKGIASGEKRDLETLTTENDPLETLITENNPCDLNSDNHQQCVENELENSCEAISEYNKNDFNFETENLKLNYKPTPHSGSVDVSFRQTRNSKKLVFKTEEKKLYVKMIPPH